MAEEPDPYALPAEVEAQRLRSLDRLHVFHSPPEDRFAHITRMAQVAMGVPMSAINFIDRTTQWCKQYSADHELDFDVPREQSVCRATIARAYQEPEDPALVYEDLTDSEFAMLPAIAQGGGVRFYAGFPLFGPGGHAVGTFCVYDTEPRQMSAQERRTFRELAAWAQRELQSSDNQRALEIAAVGMCLTEPQGRFVEVNDAFCKYFGYDADTLLQKTWQDITAPEFLQADLDRVDEMLLGHLDSYRTVKQFIHADGHLIWGDLSVACTRDDRGQVARFIAQIIDVTNEVRAREELDVARRRLRATVDSMLDPQMLLEGVRDPAGRVVDFRYLEANAAACKVMAITRDELIGRTVLDLLPGFAETGPLSYYAQCLETGEPGVLDDYSYDHEIQASSRRYDIRIAPAGNNVISLTFRDVTDRFQAAQRIAESEEKYRLLADNSTDIVCHVRDGAFVWVSPSIEAVLGATAEYWLGQKMFAHIPPEDVAEQAALMATVVGGGAIKHRGRVIGVDGGMHWLDLRAQPFYDHNGDQDGVAATLRLVDDEVAAQQQIDEARRRQARADALYRRSVDSAAVGMCLADLEGNFIEVNPALCEFFGYDADTLGRMRWQELTDPDYLEVDLDNRAKVLAGDIDSYRLVKRFIHADGHPIWGDLAVSCIRDDAGQVELFIGQIADITAEVAAREQLEQVRREKEREDERYRRSIDEAAVGMCMVTPGGRVTQINEALCRFLGLAPEAAIGTHWQDVTAPEYLGEEQNNWNGVLEGRIDSYRMVKHYRHTDGRLIWGDISVSGVRDNDGKLEHLVALITDITAEVQAREQLALSEKRNRALAEVMQSELESAARYVRSVLPVDRDGQVSVSSRYLPSSTLGGDFYDFHWIDEDHLIVYVLDVSGHGVESALIAVSVHNLMRSASLSVETLLEPDHVLAVLNHQFDTESHDDNFFTMFYGVYEVSSATLRYASGGHPPALLMSDGQLTPLATQGLPIGAIEDAAFPTTTLPVRPGSQLLVYTDGAFELPLADGGQWSLEGFVDFCTRLAEAPDWSLDDVIDNLRHRSATGDFTDDCCLVRLKFN